MDKFLQAAVDEALEGLREGGIPIGSVIVRGGEIIGRGHNRRVQKGSAIRNGGPVGFVPSKKEPTASPASPRPESSRP